MRYEEGPLKRPDNYDVLRTGNVLLDDGSRVFVGQQSRVDIVENTGRSVRGVLKDGWARFDVNPGGPRRWLIETGAFEVEVIGTSFTVSRQDDDARVRVHRGHVHIRGASVRDGALQLAAGDEFTSRSDKYSISKEAAENTIVSRTALSENGAGDARGSTATSRSPTECAQRRATSGEARDLSAEALRRADRLRAQGRSEQAARVLEREFDAHHEGSNAGLVAFTLAQLQLDDLGLSAEAAKNFSRAARAPTLPSVLREQAVARRVEALARAGLIQEASQAADAYTRIYANGSWTNAVRRWAAAKRPAQP
jgi:transmembrane sensor